MKPFPAKGHIGDLESYHKTQRDSFRQEMDEALMKYSKVFQKYTQTNEVTWEDICETIYDVGNLGLKITQLSEAWQLLITKVGFLAPTRDPRTRNDLWLLQPRCIG